MIIRVLFFKDHEILDPTKDVKDAYNKIQLNNPLIEQGWIDIDTKEDSTYLSLLLHSEYVELFGGEYKIESRVFKATKPYALWINLGETSKF